MKTSEAVASRRSIRAFLDTPVPMETLQRVLDRAQHAPSGCNFQPWRATVLTGDPLRELQDKMKVAKWQDPIEYSWSEPEQSPEHKRRLHELGALMYGAMDVGRDDKEGRRAFVDRNIISYGAPVVMMVHFERFMGPPQWSDVGMWLQTVMLLLREEGLDSCPQEWMALYARLIKDFIGVSDEEQILFCGLAIGYRDPDAPVNNFAVPRIPIGDAISWQGWD